MNSFCSYFNESKCRSCSWIEKTPAQQIQLKEHLIRTSLGLESTFVIEASVQSPSQGFRNRAKMTVTGTVEHSVIGISGDLATLDSGQELLDCPIHHPQLNRLMNSLPDLIREFNLTPYQIQNRTGELKGLIAFYSPTSHEMYLRFILRSREAVPRIKKLITELQKGFPELKCITANIQPIPHAILEGPDEIFLTESTTIRHQLGHLTFKLAPQAFVQTNAAVATDLYETAAQWIALISPQKMLELFCGQGAFSFFAADSAKQVLGVELNPDAVKTAQETAHSLGVSHLTFQASDAGAVEADVLDFQPDLILANPPRRGLGDTLSIILKASPQHFLYSSCSIETLARDLKKMAPFYAIKKVRLFDMFPHTAHFETLVWLERQG